MSAEDETVEAVENRDLETILAFKFHSFPPPISRTYKHNGRSVGFDDERVVKLENGSVQILNPTRTDSGEYTFIVSNSYGGATATINLTVLCEKPPEFY